MGCIVDKFICVEVIVFISGDGVNKLCGFLIYVCVVNVMVNNV